MERKIKKCAYCGKELTVSQRHNIYCSSECANLAKQSKKIQDWLNGIFDGSVKDGLSDSIRNYLLKQVNYKCEKCGWGEKNPITNKVPLEIHHKDGNYKNNRPENLEVLCPNCHSLTPNFKALNTSERKRAQNRKEESYCIDCGKIISTGSIRCKECETKRRITVKPFSREELKKLIRTTPFTQIGAQVGVTDNTIRKWCIQYNLPSKKRDINSYTEEEWEKI